MLSILAAAASLATTTVAYVDGWHLWRTNDGQMCGIEQPTPENTKVQIVLSSTNPTKALLIVSNTAWGTVQAGSSYDVQSQIGQQPFSGKAVGVDHGVSIAYDRDDFLNRFGKGQRIAVTRAGVKLVDLPSSYNSGASRALSACIRGGSDPFALR